MPPRPASPRPPPARRDSLWSRRRTQPGWLLLPLRAFLGVTFSYAGLQKLANPGYLDPRNPTSVARQMGLLRHSSPIGPLLGLSTHAPVLVGLLIAFGELAVGLGTLLGLWSRVAAVGGALLSLTFFLTVSWNTTPYYYGADIGFVFGWLVILGFGSGGVLSMDTWLRNRVRHNLGLGSEPATAAVSVARLRSLCTRGQKCALAADGHCTHPTGCPIFAVAEPLPVRLQAELDRRTVVTGGAAAVAVGILAMIAGGMTAVLGRVIGGTTRRTTTAVSALGPRTGAANPAAPSPSMSASKPTGGRTATRAPAGTAVGSASSVPVGQAVSFTNPADGNPAWVVHLSGLRFVAFSAICTHAGCPVQYDQSAVEFVCPCHGGVYDARTGKVLQGPPPAPLPAIPVHVVRGQIRVDG